MTKILITLFGLILAADAASAASKKSDVFSLVGRGTLVVNQDPLQIANMLTGQSVVGEGIRTNQAALEVAGHRGVGVLFVVVKDAGLTKLSLKCESFSIAAGQSFSVEAGGEKVKAPSQLTIRATCKTTPKTVSETAVGYSAVIEQQESKFTAVFAEHGESAQSRFDVVRGFVVN